MDHFKVVGTSNYDSDMFVEQELCFTDAYGGAHATFIFQSREAAQRVADAMNASNPDLNREIYWCVKSLEYKLYKFEP